ncbi:hypothetical protein BDV39DRAFT_206987 [Aspergillus sergii]|uniref:Cyanovirin-N domain-containing protein n=1 Tax=Aspergillus sergii TaxID=1034303 RepID=A0A5N6WZW8_9EURO|nr:hypothetical protein BDV39DRAFT_206987 [Aspergillus sergii]
MSSLTPLHEHFDQYVIDVEDDGAILYAMNLDKGQEVIINLDEKIGISHGQFSCDVDPGFSKVAEDIDVEYADDNVPWLTATLRREFIGNSRQRINLSKHIAFDGTDLVWI